MSEIQGLAQPDTQPEKALPLPPPPSLPTLKAYKSALSLEDADATISHLNRILSTPSGIDTILLTINYTTLLTSNVLTRISLLTLRSRVSKLMTALSNLPPNTTILIKDSKIPTSRLLRISQSLKATSTLISDFRIFMRLWGLLGIYRWAKGVRQNPPADLTQRRIAHLQILVNVFYQILENRAYLASKGVFGWSEDRQNKAWKWSCRFWAAHVGLEFWRLAYEFSKGGDEGELKGEEKKVADGAWWRGLVSNCAWLPLTLHWSLEGGLVGELWVGLFGSVAGVTALRQVWKTTAT